MRNLSGVLLCFVLAVLTNIANAQDRISDSLEKRLNSLPAEKAGVRDTNRLKLMNEISLRNKNTGDYAKGHRYANSVIQILSNPEIKNNRRDSVFLGNAYANKGLLYFREGKNDSAIIADQKAIAIWKSINDRYGYSMSLSHLSSVYQDQSDYTKALESIFEALKIRQEMKDEKGMASMYGNAGEIYRNFKDTAKAMEYYRKSLSLAYKINVAEPDNQNNNRVIGNALNNIAILLEDQGKLNEAIQYHKQALKIRTEVADKGAIAASLNNLGADFQMQGQYDSAFAYYTRAFEIKKAIGDKRGISICYLNFAQTKLLQKQYAAAVPFLDSSMLYCNMVGLPDLRLEILLTYSDVLHGSGNAEGALVYYKKYIRERDSLRSEDRTLETMRAEANYIVGVKAAADSTRMAEQAKADQLRSNVQIQKQRLYTIGGIAGFILMLIVAVVSYRAFRQKQHANEIITLQKNIVDQKQKEILDSINYAKKIQLTLIAHEDLLNQELPEYFVLFRPKDIVSGDFYWASKNNNGFYLAVCDSTGHGVPGAFMSLLNISLLNEAINEKGISTPDEILNYVRNRLIASVSKEGASDGMDGTLLRFDRNSGNITYAAAYNSPVIIQSNEVVTLPADKMPVGKGVKENHFTLNNIASQNAMLYLYTDGFADQFGGPKGKKYKYAKLNAFLASVAELPCNEQKQKLEAEFDNWKRELEQIDDVCVVGIRLT